MGLVGVGSTSRQRRTGLVVLGLGLGESAGGGGRTRTVWSPRGEGYGKSEAAEMWGGVCLMGYPTGQWIGGG